MYTSSYVIWSLAFAAGIYAQSQILKSELSFGHESRISQDLIKVPHFNIIGEPLVPQILSNKIILTPPAPGNQRGAVWTEDSMRYSAWQADVEFRASGPERGSGKLSIWLAKNGQQTVGTSSIYTVGKFEGLAIIIDNYGGTGGVIRGFLNDGKLDYKSHHSVDSTAFGHCSYAYRNLGRLSQLRISQDHHNFKVEIDGNICFETDKAQIPINYYWGVTAVSAETPDSFEINSFKVTAHTVDLNAQNDPSPPGSAAPQSPRGEGLFGIGRASPLDPPEIEASKVPVHEQFADLHNRLHAVHQHITGNHHDFAATSKRIEDKLQGIENTLRDRPPQNYHDQLRDLKDKLDAMDIRMQHIQNAVGDNWHIEDLKRTVEASHSTLLNKSPGLGMLLFIILGSQSLLVALYVVYKRRKMNGPKKYL